MIGPILSPWCFPIPGFFGLFLAEAASGTLGAGSSSAPSPAEPIFQSNIFWAYGLACFALLAFTLWTLVEVRRVSKRIDYLSERFQRAHPEENPADGRGHFPGQ